METSSSTIENEFKQDPEPVKTICRGCLSTERRVSNISEFVADFRILAGLNVSESDGLPPWLCYECSSLLQKSVRFKQKLLRANTMLSEYLMRCAPFPIDAQDSELEKFATPHLKETETLAFDNAGKSKLGFQKVLQHQKQTIVSALDSIEVVMKSEHEASRVESETGSIKTEFDNLSDYEDNITLEQFRSSVPKVSDSELSAILNDTETSVKIEEEGKEVKEVKKKKKTKKKEAKVGTKRKRGISEALKLEMILMHKKGVPISSIADTLDVTRNTVYRWVNRWIKEGNLNHHCSQGRPRKTTRDQDELLINSVKEQPAISTSDLANVLRVSDYTVRRRLREAGFRAYSVSTESELIQVNRLVLGPDLVGKCSRKPVGHLI